jgi:hypothetical protein
MRFSLRTLLIVSLLAPLTIYSAWELQSAPPILVTCLVAFLVLTFGVISAKWWSRRPALIAGGYVAMVLLVGAYVGTYYARTRSVEESMRGRVRYFNARWELYWFTPIRAFEEAYIGRSVRTYALEDQE